LLVIITTFEIMNSKFTSYQMFIPTDISVAVSIITISTTTIITPMGYIFHI
jgi:hypothetical protein